MIFTPKRCIWAPTGARLGQCADKEYEKQNPKVQEQKYLRLWPTPFALYLHPCACIRVAKACVGEPKSKEYTCIGQSTVLFKKVLSVECAPACLQILIVLLSAIATAKSSRCMHKMGKCCQNP